MKKLLSIALLSIISLSSSAQNNQRFINNAQANNSSVYVYAENGEAFYLVVNGIRQNFFPQSNVQVSGLTGNDYQMQVVFKNNHLGQISPMNIRVVDASFQYGQSVYKLAINPMGFYEMSLEQFFPGFTLTPINQTHHVVKYHSTVCTQAPVHHTTPAHSCLPACTPTQHVCSMANEPAPEPMPGYNGEIGCGDWPLSDQDFARALGSIKTKSFDRTKLVVAKQITGANCLKVSQVKQIANLFSFDSGKLEYAKFAYDHTYDPGNYYQVNDVFSFDSNTRALSDYVTNR